MLQVQDKRLVISTYRAEKARVRAVARHNFFEGGPPAVWACAFKKSEGQALGCECLGRRQQRGYSDNGDDILCVGHACQTVSTCHPAYAAERHAGNPATAQSN